MDPSGSDAPLMRFLLNRIIARSQNSSFSVYSSGVTASSARSAGRERLASASLFSPRSRTVSNVPCGQVFWRRSNHSNRLMC